MRAKSLLTFLLIGFVAISVLYVTAGPGRSAAGRDEAGGASGTPAEVGGASATPAEAAAASQAAETPEPAGSAEPLAPADHAQEPVPESPRPDRTVTAYYFHGTVRCATCMKIEAYSREVIDAAFAGPLADGALVWRPVNVDEPEHRHFLQDYQLVTRSLVLSETSGGVQQRWKNLERVWELVRDKQAFTDYVQSEVRAYLGDT